MDVSRVIFNKKIFILRIIISVFVLKEVDAGWKSKYGPFKALLYSSYITCDHSRDVNVDVSETQVFFYDFMNNVNLTFPINNAAEGITKAYNLDVSKKIIFFVPGYKSHINKKTEDLIRDKFSTVQNIYLIIIDHSAYTSARGGKIKSYERSVNHVYYIAEALGKFLSDMHKKGIKSKNIHAIGHSLGSQILANVGSSYMNLTSEKLWRITGLDPAGPCFSNSFIENQIRSGVAEYVEVYHCDAGGLGTTSVLADTDFFLNKEGKKQPNCHTGFLPGKGESDESKCSHKACVTYYADTIHHPERFPAWACNSYKDFKEGKCAGNQVTIAGYFNPGNATGVFYLSTDGFGVDK